MACRVPSEKRGRKDTILVASNSGRADCSNCEVHSMTIGSTGGLAPARCSNTQRKTSRPRRPTERQTRKSPHPTDNTSSTKLPYSMTDLPRPANDKHVAQVLHDCQTRDGPAEAWRLLKRVRIGRRRFPLSIYYFDPLTPRLHAGRHSSRNLFCCGGTATLSEGSTWSLQFPQRGSDIEEVTDL